MTAQRHDFRKPPPLPQALRTALGSWLPKVCQSVKRQFTSQLPFTVEVEAGDLTVLSAGQLHEDVPETALRFVAGLSGTSDVSMLIVPRPVLLAMLCGMLGETFDPDNPDREFTPIEENITDFLAREFFLDSLQQSWLITPKLRFDLPNRQPPRALPPYALSTQLLQVTLRLRGPFGELALWWVLPRIGWVESIVGTTTTKAIVPTRAEREDGVRALPIQMTVNLGHTELSLIHLASLEIGDVLLLDQLVDQPMTASIGGQIKFLVWPGAVGSRQAVAIHSPYESEP
jgi:flagellar motor switch protein FliM